MKILIIFLTFPVRSQQVHHNSNTKSFKFPVANHFQNVHLLLSDPKKAVILEMRKSSNFQLKLKLSTFSIISEGYFNGSYQDAENFKCKLSLKEMEEKRKLNLVIHELTSSVNSTEYCVQLKDTAERSLCSGPGKLHEKLKSSESSEWELVLAPADTELPNVRFWIEFNCK